MNEIPELMARKFIEACRPKSQSHLFPYPAWDELSEELKNRYIEAMRAVLIVVQGETHEPTNP